MRSSVRLKRDVIHNGRKLGTRLGSSLGMRSGTIMTARQVPGIIRGSFRMSVESFGSCLSRRWLVRWKSSAVQPWLSAALCLFSCLTAVKTTCANKGGTSARVNCVASCRTVRVLVWAVSGCVRCVYWRRTSGAPRLWLWDQLGELLQRLGSCAVGQRGAPMCTTSQGDAIRRCCHAHRCPLPLVQAYGLLTPCVEAC